MIGGFGRAEVFSFHATKFLNAFEGGALVTNDDEIARTARLMKNFGFAGEDKVIHPGTNGKMTEVAAAMGLTSLESIDDFIGVNRQNYHHYKDLLAGIPGVTLVPYDESPYERRNFQYVVLDVEESTSGISRDVLVDILQAERVLARRYFYPGVHHMEPYRSYFPHAGLVLPNTERLVRRVMTLPTGTAVGEAHIAQICDLIRFCVNHAEEIRALKEGRS
jgi:dTDP-4-amino-4,6-dideoxygalactose transaminase